MGVTFVVTAILSIMVLSKSLETMAETGICPTAPRFGCHKVCREIYVNQFDENGKNCSGLVTIWGCSGLCFTYTTPYFDFPHKKYDHKVCIHDEREWKEVPIPNCVEGAANEIRSYRYVAPKGCKCAGCYSADTSCETARKRGNPSPPEAEETSLLMEFLLAPGKTRKNRWQEIIPQILQPPVYP